MTRKIVSASALTLLLAWGPIAAGQALQYNSQAELLGAAATGPLATKSALSKLLTFCTDGFPSTTAAANATMQRWQQRNAFYVTASSGYRGALNQLMNDPKVASSTRESLHKFVDVDVPRMLAARTEALLEPLRVATENGSGESLCKDYLAAMDAGQFDIRHNDPQLAEFIDKNAPRPGK
jgi:hypothetical protein